MTARGDADEVVQGPGVKIILVSCMQRTRPVHDHPEFTVREHQGCTEYRVENWRISHNGSRNVLKNYGWSWVDPVIPILTAVLWQTVCIPFVKYITSFTLDKISRNRFYITLFACFMSAYVYAKCASVLWGKFVALSRLLAFDVLTESIIVIPSYGIQFETYRGPLGVPLFSSRRFIPFVYLQDFVINEGLHGWNVRYYLAAVEKPEMGVVRLHVPYEVRFTYV